MYQNKAAFTLIELLVVVLIIGILAAVAIPQYQKAVWKSRMMQAVTLGRAYMTAQEAYFLANAEYSTTLDGLDISLPELSSWRIWVGNHLMLRNDEASWNFWPAQKRAECCANPNSSQFDVVSKVCQSITGNNNPVINQGSGWSDYSMSF